MKRLLVGVLGLLLATTAFAGVRAARASVEASMVVTGTIGITAQGTVLAYTLDHPEKLPPAVADLIGKDVPGWMFEPVRREGKPVAAKAKMTLRIVATPMGDGNFRIAVRSVYFGDEAKGLKSDRSVAPRYPYQAIRNRAEGTVYLALRLDRAGKVTDAAAQQVNLRTIGPDIEMKHWRKAFAKATLEAAKQWTFTASDPSDHAPYRDVRISVSYWLSNGLVTRPPTYGRWDTYVPGPLEPVPWSDEDRMLTGGADALPGDGVYGAPSLSLVTPLDRS